MKLRLNKIAVGLLFIASLTGITACSKSDDNQPAATVTPSVDLTISAEKINEIKQRIKSGTYNIDSRSLAKAILKQ